MKEKTYYEEVWELTQNIPEGRVTTYGTIADTLTLGSARMVGWALRNRNRCESEVPAHRVVNRNGELSGRRSFTPPERMQFLLENEGIVVENHKISDFKNVFWSPLELLG